MPRIEEIFTNLNGGEKFAVIDLKNAYLQFELDETSRPFMTINTHLGLFQFQRLPFGVASAPEIWQRAMDQVLQGIPGVQCYLDDIMVTGATTEKHLAALEEVLARLEAHGLRANKKMQVFPGFRHLLRTCHYVLLMDYTHRQNRLVP